MINDVADNCIKAECITILDGYTWAKTSAEAGKCLSSDADITISGGTLKLYTSGNAIYEEDENDTSSAAGIKADGDLAISDCYILCVSSGEDGKGINVDGRLTIESGKIEIATLGGKYVYNAAQDLDSSPKGVKADGEIIINGGVVIASGSATPEGGVDCDRSQNFIVSGGTIIGTGGAAVSTSTSSTQRSVIYNGVRAKTGELFVITDADGQSILKYELPRTMTSMAIFFSSPDIRQGATYTVYSGGSLSGNTINWNGWFEDGKYNKGTELGTFTSDNINTTVGQSSGLGGGPGNGDPGNGSPGNGGFGPGWWN